jgi:hypothetical protein
MSSFAQSWPADTTTLSEIVRVKNVINASSFFGCYAYATHSGFRAFDLGLGSEFWSDTPSRWLFGIDYGRTDPRALRAIADANNTQVRIFDGEAVVRRPGFKPRRDFHPKVALLENPASGAHGLVLGSGNFSYNGLQRGVEAGTAIVTADANQYSQLIEPVSSVFSTFWDNACPLAHIIDDYEELYHALIASKDTRQMVNPDVPRTGFWIEAGHVTKNRGPGRPGNQIFAPRGFRRFFGLDEAEGNSTLIGEITFEMEMGPRVTKNYRDNDNAMEKLTLPMPEDHGFGVYDGKVLVFEPRRTRFRLSAIELDDFELIFRHRLANVGVMTGGRRFGEIV